eukprot:592178_1
MNTNRKLLFGNKYKSKSSCGRWLCICGSQRMEMHRIDFIVSESGYDVTFSNCKTSYDTRLDVYNEDKSVTISYTYCDGDDCGYSGFPLCASYNSNEAFTIPSMDAGTYYIGIRYNDTLYFERYYRFVLE